MILLMILLATAFVGLISFIGVVFLGTKFNQQKVTFYLISLASGTMLGTALLHLIPESLEQNKEGALLMISLGVFTFFVLEKLLVWRHCHLHQHLSDHSRPTAANLVLVGDAIHNFIDGAIIAGAFMANPAIGFSVSTAIILHEIPQELGDFGILLHGGYAVKKAIVLNAMTATFALLGAVLTYFSLESLPMVQAYLLPFAAGGFLYIALADLIPQLHEQVAAR